MDPTGYIKATIESAERQLRERGIPSAIIQGFSAEVWEDEHITYGCRADATLSPFQQKLAKLIAVSKAYLEVFGTRSNREFALAMEWQKLERECFSATSENTRRSRRKGGKVRGGQRRKEGASKREEIIATAKKKRSEGYSDHNLSGVVAHIVGRSVGWVRTILQEEGILKKRE